MLTNQTYKPSPYIVKTIKDSGSGKEREISKPAFYPDQCIHWSLMLIVEPLFHKRFYKWTCASIKNRGTYYAQIYVKNAIKDRKHTKYAYQLDIKKFYPSINNEILKLKLRDMFKDKSILWLFNTIIDSSKGLPIGNYTSQWLANFYLDDLDKYIKETLHIKYYVRYADDMLLFSSNKRNLHNVRKQVEKYVKEVDDLSIKSNWKIYNTNSRPIDYIGFYFYKDHIILRSKLYLRIKRRAKKIGKKGKVSIKDARSMTSYWGYIKHTDSHKFYIKDIKPYCNINICKEVIRNEDKKFQQNNK